MADVTLLGRSRSGPDHHCVKAAVRRALTSVFALLASIAMPATALTMSSDQPHALLHRTDLCIYVNADPVDSHVASQLSDSLTDKGVTAFLSPEPEPSQQPEQIRSAQQELIEECNGVVLVYGQTPATWVQAQFKFTQKVVASRLRGVWGALLDVAPQSRPPAPVRSPHLLPLDCRQGFDPGK